MRWRYKAARIRSHALSLETIVLSSTSLYCFSVQQGPVRDCGVQISRQTRRLRLGRHPGHSDSLFQAAEADFHCVRQLHPKVGSVGILPVRCWFLFLRTIKSTFDLACVSHEHDHIYFIAR